MPRRIVVRAVHDALRSVLDVMSRTVGTARDIFREDHELHQSMVGSALAHFQSDSSNVSTDGAVSDLRLTTTGLLTSLPSSAHFLFLPQSIKSYKPYIDLTSTSSTLHQEELSRQVREWFGRATDHFKAVAEQWLTELESVREVWIIRARLRKWIRSVCQFEDVERNLVLSLLDACCSDRIRFIWGTGLKELDSFFRERVQSAITSLMEGGKDSRLGTSMPSTTYEPKGRSLYTHVRRFSCIASIPGTSSSFSDPGRDERCIRDLVFPKV